MAYHTRVCKSCYNKLRSETLAATYICPGEPSWWAQFWDNRTVYLGNLPYKWERKDIESWIWEHVLLGRDVQLPLFYVRCEKGGRQGDHGCAIAFVEFVFARDAKVFVPKQGYTFNYGLPVRGGSSRYHPGFLDVVVG